MFGAMSPYFALSGFHVLDLALVLRLFIRMKRYACLGILIGFEGVHSTGRVRREWTGKALTVGFVFHRGAMKQT